jgi:hypothetical protein
LKKERLPSVDLLQRGRTRAGAEWGGSGMQRARKWAPTILHNVSTCCHLHTLCNNGDVAQNHKERLLRLVGKLGLLRPRDLQGMIFSLAHGDMAFTVPLFDEFMLRAMPQMEKNA